MCHGGSNLKNKHFKISDQANVYGSIVIYKSISLCVLLILTVILSVLFHKDKALFHEMSDRATPAFFIVVGICIFLFIASICFDFYILSKTIAIGKRLRNLAYLDRLTGLPNRYSCDLLLESFSPPERLQNAGFILLQISNLASVNSKDGLGGGNFLITEFSAILEDVSQEYGYAGRNGGNEFIVLIDNCDSTAADMFLMDLTKRIHGYNELNVGTPLEVSYIRVLNCDEHKEKISDLVSTGYRRFREMPQVLS